MVAGRLQGEVRPEGASKAKGERAEAVDARPSCLDCSGPIGPHPDGRREAHCMCAPPTDPGEREAWRQRRRRLEARLEDLADELRAQMVEATADELARVTHTQVSVLGCICEDIRARAQDGGWEPVLPCLGCAGTTIVGIWNHGEWCGWVPRPIEADRGQRELHLLHVAAVGALRRAGLGLCGLPPRGETAGPRPGDPTCGYFEESRRAERLMAAVLMPARDFDSAFADARGDFAGVEARFPRVPLELIRRRARDLRLSTISCRPPVNRHLVRALEAGMIILPDHDAQAPAERVGTERLGRAGSVLRYCPSFPRAELEPAIDAVVDAFLADQARSAA